MATAYHNEEHMITEYYKSPIDGELLQEGKEELYDLLSYTPMSNEDWMNKQDKLMKLSRTFLIIMQKVNL